MIMHNSCFPARGVKYFKCIKCEEGSFNYTNGVGICSECLFKGDLCSICGNPMADKKPISTETDSILDYEKKYNMWDATHLMKNHDVQMIDSKFGYTWKYYQTDRTIMSTEYNNIEDLFNKEFGYIDSLDLTFTLIKPVEEVKENWVKISSHKDLATAIAKGKEIVAFNTHTKVTTIRTRVFTEEIIDELFKQLSYNYLEIKYLEEN